MGLNWFFSSTVRHASHMRKHVQKILSAQRDVLSPEAIRNVETANEEMRRAIQANTPKKQLLEKMKALEDTANKWLKSYPNAGLRENVEVLLVAITVAMGIRTFFIQPFKIPTGSMQPTLYGITSTPDYTSEFVNAGPEHDFPVPNPVSRFFIFWFSGVSYTHVKAKTEGSLQAFEEKPKRFLLFNLWQKFVVGGETYRVWFPPDNLLQRSGLLTRYGPNPRVFKPGEDIVKIKVTSGDHLFVDRMSYNFRRPKLGEIIVFETKGISALPQDQFYIKRMVGMDGQKVSVGNDRHVRLDGKRLDASVPHFENVYNFDPAKPPMNSVYSGHVNEHVAAEHGIHHNLAPLFPDGNAVFQVPKNHYIVMGDNTVNSSDSRFWGSFSRENVIGRSFFVYWPFGPQPGRGESRFGWGHR